MHLLVATLYFVRVFYRLSTYIFVYIRITFRSDGNICEQAKFVKLTNYKAAIEVAFIQECKQ